jgi:transcriptional regulator with GAF, ATPase, and Fis domain
VDVRVIAATHRDMPSLVAQGRFREDLWYRVSVFPIRLPPLRERREDIPQLAAHFAWKAGKRLGAGPLALSPGDLDLLLTYPWPGNVRELASVIERAAILGNGRQLMMAAALGSSPTAPVSEGTASPRAVPVPAPPRTSPPPSPSTDDEGLSLDEGMRRQIEETLALTHGRIEGPFGAALRLRINPHTLRARMRKLGIDWSRFRRPSVPQGPTGG